MKAALCHEFGRPLVIEEVAIDPPESGEVQVRLAACAICHSDVTYADGGWGGPLPAIYGHEAAGVVEAAGPGVKLVAPGDHVVVTLIRACGRCFFCRSGAQTVCPTPFPRDERAHIRTRAGTGVHQGLRTAAFAEVVVVDESQVVAIPDTVPLDSASLLACGVITGLGAVVNTAKVPPGSSVAVVGTGGVGLNCVQGARLCGADPIVAVDVSRAKLDAARRFGATHTVNAVSEGAQAEVRACTEGRGADYVFVAAGNTAAVELGLRLMRLAGTTVLVGMPPDGETAEIEITGFAGGGHRIVGSKMGSTRLRVDMPRLIEHYQAGRLKLDELISRRYRLEEINEAIASVKRNEALRNVIMFNGSSSGTSPG